MNVFGKWERHIKVAGTLLGLAFFAHRAVALWHRRRHHKRLARKRPPSP